VKTKQTQDAQVQTIETALLDEVAGGCNCGCGMPNCGCGGSGSCGGGAASRFRFPAFNFFRR
jgi:hypothetical protein